MQVPGRWLVNGVPTRWAQFSCVLVLSCLQNHIHSIAWLQHTNTRTRTRNCFVGHLNLMFAQLSICKTIINIYRYHVSSHRIGTLNEN